MFYLLAIFAPFILLAVVGFRFGKPLPPEEDRWAGPKTDYPQRKI